MLKKTNAWLWIPSLYFASGLPYHAITSISDIMYKDMGVDNTSIALYTSILLIPWTIKPLWSPFVEMIGTRRSWTFRSQLLLVLCFAAIALAVPSNNFVLLTLIAFMAGAFVSSTHDIALDGFYILGLTQKQQSFFSGIRNTFYRIATVFSSGVLVMFADWLGKSSGNDSYAWSATFAVTALIMAVLFIYHRRILPQPEKDIARMPRSIGEIFYNFGDIIKTYYRKPGIWAALLFLLLFRFPEAQLGKIGKLFLMDGYAVPALYEDVQQFSDSVAVVKFDGKYGYVDYKGKEIIPAKYDMASPFIQGIAQVTENGKTGYIDKEGKDTICPAGYQHTTPAVPVLEIEKACFGSGITEEYDSIGDIINGYAIVKKEGKYGFIGRNGKKATPLIFDHAEAPVDGTAIVGIDNKMGHILLNGGMCLSKGDIGFLNGVVGVVGLILGGILGGICISRKGLRYWLWPMVIAISLPDAVYIYMSMELPGNLDIVGSCIFIEQLGYGFGFTAYTLYMIYFAQGKYPTAHFAISTAFMSLGMMLPGMISGKIQELVGYENFFIWVMICTSVTFAVSAFIKVDPNFGKK
jgi:MFS family permease